MSSASAADDAASETAAPGAAAPQAIVAKSELTYNDHLEELIASEAEKALVLRWLHNESEAMYSRLNTFITLPVICISTVAGTVSIGQDTLFGKDNAGAPIGVGVLSLIVSILNVIASFFGWAKRSEGHRISGINYAKLHRWISIELALPREQRMPAKHFLKEVRAQVDRLNETSPPVPPVVVEKFQSSVKGLKDDVSLPEICNQIHAVVVYPGHIKHGAAAPGTAQDAVPMIV
jgi:hypothetical protein